MMQAPVPRTGAGDGQQHADPHTRLRGPPVRGDDSISRSFITVYTSSQRVDITLGTTHRKVHSNSPEANRLVTVGQASMAEGRTDNGAERRHRFFGAG